MSRRMVKVRILPSHLRRADELRQWWAYHAPDGPYPTRNLILTSALTKGLRTLDRRLESGHLTHLDLPSEGIVSTYPRVRFDRSMLAFADRLRDPLYRARCLSTDLAAPISLYPSRLQVLMLAVQVGLDEVSALYARPLDAPLHAS